jgi:hypothetical protein
MANQHENIPVREKLSEQNGLMTSVWHRFLYVLFGDYEKRIQDLETQIADHETRIAALEP